MDDKLTGLLEGLSSKMGTTVDHLYQVLVKQAKIDAVVSIITFAVLIGLFPVCLICWDHLLPHCVGKDWPVEIQLMAVFLAIGSIMLFILFIVQLLSTVDIVSKAIWNPEASAIEKILGCANNKNQLLK